ncbi:N-6 DNA methylase [Saccharopolyspora erythraea]|uniref:N-6 DNA methylase n=1 Tax=Saccharopolyspora erythraea TaxID=1836 RepID=UPI001BAB50FB|nr:N-6 DNA methylase [Saccharopolyspora erythraea]QUH04994.1 N-6 DNA methylase [Saccharopolyspora erythraea]
MSQDATVNAGDIARLVDVGRAAVSNWRRRYDDFPRPVGGTSASPLFSLREVEEWLRRNGKPYQVPMAERAWQRLRTASDDLRLGRLVADAGAFLLRRRDFMVPGFDGGVGDPELAELLTALADERGEAETFEFLCDRYREAHSRRLVTTPDAVASLMVRLCEAEGTVFDPACGLGTLLLAAPASRALGQEADGPHAAISAARLLLRGTDAEVVAADSLREDGFRGSTADAVLCDPPFNERSWGHGELTGDPRWEFGMPPRGEPELAWVQHCLAHARPGAPVAILMPPAAASRRPGKRIRGNLLRAGALRAIVTLPAGGNDLWLLRRPAPGDRPPSHLLLLEADDLSSVEPVWERHAAEPESAGTRIIDLLDDDVDLSPAANRLRRTGRRLGRDFATALEELRGASLPLPELEVLPERRSLPITTIGEMAKAGLITIRHGSPRMPLGAGETPVLTADDVAGNHAPSGWTTATDGMVPLHPGDVVATATGAARVVRGDQAVLGPYLTLYRVDRAQVDPEYIAGALRSADPRPGAGSSRVDARRTRLPRLPLEEQRAYGRAFARLAELEDTARETAELAGRLARLGFDGLLDGRLSP